MIHKRLPDLNVSAESGSHHSHRAAICAWVASRAEYACLAILKDHLPSAKQGSFITCDGVQGMSQVLQAGDGVRRQATFDGHLSACFLHIDAEARQIQRALWIQSIVHERGEDLDVS